MQQDTLVFTNTCWTKFNQTPGGPVVKNLPGNAGDSEGMTLIPGSGRFPGGGNGKLLQYSCLEKSMDREAWQATVHGVTRVRHKRAHTQRCFKDSEHCHLKPFLV